METASGMLCSVKEDVKTPGGDIPPSALQAEEMELVRLARVELSSLDFK